MGKHIDIRVKLLLSSSPDENGCWIWTKYKDKDGYGTVRYKGKMWRAARLAYLLFVGPIPEGEEVDHICRVRACIRPTHLEAVPHYENMRRGIVDRNRSWVNQKRRHG